MRSTGQRTDSDGSSANLRSDGRSVFILKIWAPLIWLIAIGGLFGGDRFNWRLLFAVPLLVALVFHVSLAIVQLRGGELQYRRLLRWNAVARADIVASGRSWAPWIGYIQLKRFLFPWGRLYFVLDRQGRPNPFGQTGSGILLHLTERQLFLAERTGSPEPNVVVRSFVPMKLIMAAIAGVLVSLMRFYLQTSSPSDQGRPEAPFVASLIRASQMLSHPLVAIIVGLCFLVLSLYMRKRPTAWTFAFLAGLCLPLAFAR